MYHDNLKKIMVFGYKLPSFHAQESCLISNPLNIIMGHICIEENLF